MSVELNFDATTVPPAAPLDTLPQGIYRAHVTDSETKPTSAGTGAYLQLTWTILDGEHKGRKIWTRHNLKNPNKQTEEIAQRELSAICHAVGVLRVKNSAELHHKPALLHVVVKPGSNGYGPKNEVKKYEACEGAAVAASPAPAPQAATSAPAWARKSA